MPRVDTARPRAESGAGTSPSRTTPPTMAMAGTRAAKQAPTDAPRSWTALL